LALQGPLEGAFEVAQRLGTGLANAGVAVAGADDVFLAAWLDARQGQFLAKDLGHFLHRQFDFEDMSARLVARPLAVALLWRAQRLPGLTRALTRSTGPLLTVAKLRHFDLRQGNADEVLPLLADHLAAADVFGKVAFHLAADELLEPLVVALDLLSHGPSPG